MGNYVCAFQAHGDTKQLSFGKHFSGSLHEDISIKFDRSPSLKLHFPEFIICSMCGDSSEIKQVMASYQIL